MDWAEESGKRFRPPGQFQIRCKTVSARDVCLASFWIRHRVIPASVKRVAASQAPEREQSAHQRSKPLYRARGVFGARRLITTHSRHVRRYDRFIEADETEERSLHPYDPGGLWRSLPALASPRP